MSPRNLLKGVYQIFSSLSIRWGVVLGVLATTVGLAAATTLSMQLMWLSLQVLFAIVLIWRGQPVIHEALPMVVQNLLRLSGDRILNGIHQRIAAELINVSICPDQLFRSLAKEQLQRIIKELQTLGRHKVEYDSTEAWRVAYEQLLRSPGLYQYRSVSHVETQNYWQDGPGRRSAQLNIDLQTSGIVVIERIVIVAPHLWSEGNEMPDEPIREWIEEQAIAGIRIRLVRESKLAEEPELVNDFGIYGIRAVGMQCLDATGRTLRFVLSFDFSDVQRAEKCWEQLLLHAQDYTSARGIRANF